MPQIIVVNQSGEESSLEANEGRTLMETIRDAGFDELLALCGGCCSCAPRAWALGRDAEFARVPALAEQVRS